LLLMVGNYDALLITLAAIRDTKMIKELRSKIIVHSNELNLASRYTTQLYSTYVTNTKHHITLLVPNDVVAVV
jgi:hypothetical protein